MYICKFEQKSAITQMELSDFAGAERKIVFDMEKEEERRIAHRILQPKANKRTGSPKPRIDPKKQRSIEDLLPIQLPRMKKKQKKSSSPKTKHSDVAELIKKHNIPKSVGILNSDQETIELAVKKTKQSKKQTSKQIKQSTKKIISPQPLDASQSIQKSSAEIVPKGKYENGKDSTKQVGNKSKKSSTKTIKSSKAPSTVLETPKFQKIDSLTSEHVVKKEVSLKPITSEKMELQKPETETEKPSQNSIKHQGRLIPIEQTLEFGQGGNFEVICPVCEDIIYFDKDDLDMKKPKNTRICTSCDAIVRISSRNYNKGIFKDLTKVNVKLKQAETGMFDEFHNPIYSYAIKNEAR